MLFGKFRILGKLALLTLVPLLGVVALSVPIIVDRVSVARDAQRTTDAVELAARVGSALQELEEERLLSVAFLFAIVQQPELVVQSAKAQNALAELNRLDQPLPAALRQAIASAAQLGSTRQKVLNRTIRPDLVVSDFTTVITPIINGVELVRQADLTTAAGRQIFALDQSLRSDDLISQLTSHLTSAVVTRQPGLVDLFALTFARLEQLFTAARPYLTPEQYQLYQAGQQAFATRVGVDFFLVAATNRAAAVRELDIATLFPSLRSVIILGGFVEKRIAKDVDVAVTRDRNAALRDAFLVGGGSLLLLLLVITLSIFMARAVARPLRRLTVSADRIARAAESELQRVADDEAEATRPIRLDPVDVQAKDEIGDLARAFDRVQTTAVRLVERQVAGRRNVAQMFGHVGRRTQNLVGRQLALIDSLERRETDSDRLRELYRLDHMSSRLRRNASSLVVLSGGAGANEHMAPLPLCDVVRLALGEIEDYTRVDVEVPEEIVVVPSMVADLTLLLAELMENATSFSPPHTRVTVTAAELRGGARLAVVDHGLGLSPERLAEENARLTRRERLDLAPSEVLGLFVVGRLARRHGVEVTLTDTPDGGVTAWVDLDREHLISPAEAVTTGGPPIQAHVPSGQSSEFAPLLAGSAVRSAPGNAQPFDPNVLGRATRTLQDARSWNAFQPLTHAGAPELPAGPVYEGEPVYEQSYPPPCQEPVPAPAAQRWDTAGSPVAGRFPSVLPELPVGGRYPITEPPAVAQAAGAPPVPRQRPPAGERYYERLVHPDTGPAAPPRNGGAALRRRVPGSQLPAGSGTPLPAAPPSAGDALAARAAFEAFEAGVSRAQWDVIEADMSSPPAAGHTPLARRVPGATLPVGDPVPALPAASPAPPLDPDAARALVEQFEHGVALALSETQSRHEGRPR